MSHPKDFKGIIGATFHESKQWWPEPVRARPGSPNVLFIVIDDVGFGQLGCFGGLADTPNIDTLAQNGLRYNNFHTTALCSPTRSCILTGRNHHSNAMGGITEISTGFPGYNGSIPKENGFLSEMLLPYGYATFAVGKWHLTPHEQTNMAAARDRWPLGRGFERFYGFLGGETNQYYPDLVYDNHPINPPKTPDEGYHLTEDLADKAIEFIKDLKQVAPDKPFFMYFCPGACHAPHHVPKEWRDKYKGRFDLGWDAAREAILSRQKQMGIVPANTELTPRDEEVKPWDSLSADEKRLYSRMMEVYAGYLSHADHHIGRLIAFLKEVGEFDNTLVMLVSDNGASAEGDTAGSINEGHFFNGIPENLQDNLAQIDKLGSPDSYNHYPMGWTMAGNTPFLRWKRETYNGGICDPCIVHWPAVIKAKGEVRSQYIHAIDMVPTVMEALGVERPERIQGVTQDPIEGLSFLSSFNDAAASSLRTTQYYEMFAYRAIYHDGWKAVCPWPFNKEISADDLGKSRWSLYNLREDYSECHDLADQYPEKAQEMAVRWWVEAGKHNVLPLDGRGESRLLEPRPKITPDRTAYVYYPGALPVPENVAAPVKNRSHRITAEVEIPDQGVQGVLLSIGSIFGGFSLYVKDRRLHYVHNFVGNAEYKISSGTDVPCGSVTLGFEFIKTGEHQGRGILLINGQTAGEGDIPHTVPDAFTLSGEGMACGYDVGEPVTHDYQSPFRFTGTIKRVIVETGGEAARNVQHESRVAFARE